MSGSTRLVARVASACFLLSAGLSVVGLSSAGCSLLVDSEPDVIYCRDAGHIGPPACDPGSVCALGRCRVCAAHDACGDGVDNDCNGRVDDGCPEAPGAAGMAGSRAE